MTDEPNIKNDDRLAGGGVEDRLRELLAKATPGPWQSKDPYLWDEIIGNVDGPDDGQYHYTEVAQGFGRADAALIVAAVNALPGLLAELAALRQRCEQAERRLNEASHDAIYEAHKREQAERERDEAVGVLRHIDVLPDEPDPIARLCEARKAARRVLRKRDAALAHDAQDKKA